MESLPDQQMPYLIGHSLGGHLSLQYSLRHPDLIKALVLIDPFYSQAQLSAGVQWLARRPALGVKALRQVSRKMVHASTYLDAPLRGNFPPEARQQIALDMKRAAPEILHILPSVTDLTPELSSVQTPTLVIYGSRDLTLRPSSFPRLADEMANASLVKVPGVGHLPHLARPQAVNQAILDFLAKYPQ